MKTILLLLFGLLASVSVHAQPLLTKSFQLQTQSEVRAELTMSAPGTDWAVKGREAAAVRLEIDGTYHQDILLFGGARKHIYPVSLGKLPAGSHTLRVLFNAAQSAPNDARAVIHDASVAPIGRANALEAAAIAHAPILYARPDTVGRFSDVPLLMWYEFVPDGNATIVRYSVIFTNEDGGTQTAALMARWGRVTDIEWVYEFKLDASGKITGEVFQGTNHRVLPFNGAREAGHPLLAVASVNNNFTDEIAQRTAPRFAPAPVAFDTANQSRESLMDQHPWTYRVMVDEMQREGRIAQTDAEIAGVGGLGMKIADLRRYLYFDALGKQQQAGLSFAVKLKGDARWYASDLGNSSFRIARDGWFRTTVRMPARVGVDAIEQIVVRCDAAPDVLNNKQVPADPSCNLGKIQKLFFLDDNYQPGESLPVHPHALTLGFGEAREIYRK